MLAKPIMKILYLSNRYQANITEAAGWFEPHCEPNDLLLYTSMEDAKIFISNEIIDKQKHIDLIITDWRFSNGNASSLLDWLRNSEEIYSARNFQVKALPVILIEDETQQSAAIAEGFNAVISSFPDRFRTGSAIRSTIKEWRYSIANDLELIGLDPKTQQIYPGHRSAFISYYRLQVLSRAFVDDKSRRLNYLWTTSDIKSLGDSNQAFYEKMHWTIKHPPKYLEKEFHDFFLKHPTFLKGENYSWTGNDMLYERHFYKNGTREYDEPDFINKPHNYSLSSPEVFEIKRQSQRLLRYKKDSFLSKTKKSFEQVQRYKAYMTSTDPLHQYYIKHHLGQLYDHYEFTLLMGSINEKKENEDLIARLKNEFEFEDINLITYEELLDRHIRLCNRIDAFNIF